MSGKFGKEDASIFEKLLGDLILSKTGLEVTDRLLRIGFWDLRRLVLLAFVVLGFRGFEKGLNGKKWLNLKNDFVLELIVFGFDSNKLGNDAHVIHDSL